MRITFTVKRDVPAEQHVVVEGAVLPEGWADLTATEKWEWMLKFPHEKGELTPLRDTGAGRIIDVDVWGVTA